MVTTSIINPRQWCSCLRGYIIEVRFFKLCVVLFRGGEEGGARYVEPDVGSALSRVREVVVGYVPSLGGVVDFLVENLEAGNHVILLGGVTWFFRKPKPKV